MIEAIVSASVAVIAGGWAYSNKLHTRINNVHGRVDKLDQRIDTLELRIATNYVLKQDFSTAIAKMENHMVRIEDKLDQVIMKHG